MEDINSNKIIPKINKRKYTKEELIVLDSIRRYKNPFKMIGIQYVMKDLNICETSAYKLFRRPDFPSINVGKNNQVMLLAYILWKMKKRD